MTRTELHRAIEQLDDALGAGYAAAHPELLAAFIQAEAITEAAARVSTVIGGLREALRSDHPLQGQTFDGVEAALQAIASAVDGLPEVVASMLEENRE